MIRVYLDTSAALKLLIEEPESVAIARALDEDDVHVVSSWLLETEMRRAVHRLSVLTQVDVTELLDSIDLYEMPGSVFREAGLLPGTPLRSLDALHLGVAVRLGVRAVATYDARMQEAATSIGVPVLAPT